MNTMHSVSGDCRRRTTAHHGQLLLLGGRQLLGIGLHGVQYRLVICIQLPCCCTGPALTCTVQAATCGGRVQARLRAGCRGAQVGGDVLPLGCRIQQAERLVVFTSLRRLHTMACA